MPDVVFTRIRNTPWSLMLRLIAALLIIVGVRPEICRKLEILALRHRHINRAGLIQLQQDWPQDQGRGEGSDENRNLLIFWGRAHQKTCLEILRRGPSVGCRNTNDAATRQSGNNIGRCGPTDEQKNQRSIAPRECSTEGSIEAPP